MTTNSTLTQAKQDAVDAIVGALIDEAKKHGFDLMGIDYPAIQVRKAVAEWLVAARQFKPVSTSNS